MKKGFTLIELIIVISIILMSGFGFANYVAYQERLRLSTGAGHIVDLLQQARSQAVNVELPVGCAYDQYVGSGIEVSSANSINIIILCPPLSQTIRTESLTAFPHVSFDTSSVGTVIYFDKFYGKAHITGSSLCLKSSAFTSNNYAAIHITDSWALSLNENISACP
ncbi:MAG: prepilin-type N-terminal cleavage/methylation domain-containing protein [Candidatus Roizmanbacteria bacterium]|nr:prepilin-type N-terminal cleavage/methylation domain-containing protein [Candidatus Roizmanbacteria bacterium]